MNVGRAVNETRLQVAVDFGNETEAMVGVILVFCWDINGRERGREGNEVEGMKGEERSLEYRLYWWNGGGGGGLCRSELEFFREK